MQDVFVKYVLVELIHALPIKHFNPELENQFLKQIIFPLINKTTLISEKESNLLLDRITLKI